MVGHTCAQFPWETNISDAPDGDGDDDDDDGEDDDVLYNKSGSRIVLMGVGAVQLLLYLLANVIYHHKHYKHQKHSAHDCTLQKLHLCDGYFVRYLLGPYCHRQYNQIY